MNQFVVPVIVSSFVLLLVRILLALAFAYESRYKFRDIRGFAKNDSVPVPAAYFVATMESLAALSMLSGVLSQWAGLGIILLMLVTTSFHVFKWHSPYKASKRGWEYDILMIALAAVIVVYGPGQFALFGW